MATRRSTEICFIVKRLFYLSSEGFTACSRMFYITLRMEMHFNWSRRKVVESLIWALVRIRFTRPYSAKWWEFEPFFMYLLWRGAILIVYITFSATFITKLVPLNYFFKEPQPRRPSPCYGPTNHINRFWFVMTLDWIPGPGTPHGWCWKSICWRGCHLQQKTQSWKLGVHQNSGKGSSINDVTYFRTNFDGDAF